MAYYVECLLEVNEVVVKVALVLSVFCNNDSAVEYMYNFTPSCSAACSTLRGWLVKLMVRQSMHCLRLPFFGRGITSDLVHSIGHFSIPRSSDIVSGFTVPSTPLLISSEGCRPFQETCLFSMMLLLPLHYRRTVVTFSEGPVDL